MTKYVRSEDNESSELPMEELMVKEIIHEVVDKMVPKMSLFLIMLVLTLRKRTKHSNHISIPSHSRHSLHPLGPPGSHLCQIHQQYTASASHQAQPQDSHSHSSPSHSSRNLSALRRVTNPCPSPYLVVSVEKESCRV